MTGTPGPQPPRGASEHRPRVFKRDGTWWLDCCKHLPVQVSSQPVGMEAALGHVLIATGSPNAQAWLRQRLPGLAA